MKDMTKGNPTRLILQFAIPLLIGQLFQQVYSLTDTRIVGSFLGENALAAVGATNSLNSLVIGFLMKMRAALQATLPETLIPAVS